MASTYRGGKVHVLESKCSTCIFRPGNLMFLPDGRRDALVKENIDSGGAIACHQTLDGDQAVCRGFFDVHKDDVPGLTVGERLGMIVFDPQPEEK